MAFTRHASHVIVCCGLGLIRRASRACFRSSSIGRFQAKSSRISLFSPRTLSAFTTGWSSGARSRAKASSTHENSARPRAKKEAAMPSMWTKKWYYVDMVSNVRDKDWRKMTTCSYFWSVILNYRCVWRYGCQGETARAIPKYYLPAVFCYYQ